MRKFVLLLALLGLIVFAEANLKGSAKGVAQKSATSLAEVKADGDAAASAGASADASVGEASADADASASGSGDTKTTVDAADFKGDVKGDQIFEELMGRVKSHKTEHDEVTAAYLKHLQDQHKIVVDLVEDIRRRQEELRAIEDKLEALSQQISSVEDQVSIKENTEKKLDNEMKEAEEEVTVIKNELKDDTAARKYDTESIHQESGSADDLLAKAKKLQEEEARLRNMIDQERKAYERITGHAHTFNAMTFPDLPPEMGLKAVHINTRTTVHIDNLKGAGGSVDPGKPDCCGHPELARLHGGAGAGAGGVAPVHIGGPGSPTGPNGAPIGPNGAPIGGPGQAGQEFPIQGDTPPSPLGGNNGDNTGTNTPTDNTPPPTPSIPAVDGDQPAPPPINPGNQSPVSIPPTQYPDSVPPVTPGNPLPPNAQPGPDGENTLVSNANPPPTTGGGGGVLGGVSLNPNGGGAGGAGGAGGGAGGSPSGGVTDGVGPDGKHHLHIVVHDADAPTVVHVHSDTDNVQVNKVVGKWAGSLPGQAPEMLEGKDGFAQLPLIPQAAK